MRYSKPVNKYTVACTLVRETEKAFLLRVMTESFNHETRSTDNSWENLWFPKSQVSLGLDATTVSIPEWLMTEKDVVNNQTEEGKQ